MKRYHLSVILFLIFVSSMAYAGSPKDDLNDDVLMSQAVLEIQKMGREELDVFVSFLASCEPSNGGQFRDYYCDRERENYLIKYESGRSLDRLIKVLKIGWMLIESSDKMKKKTSEKNGEIDTIIVRYVNIMGLLKSSANLRYQKFIK